MQTKALAILLVAVVAVVAATLVNATGSVWLMSAAQGQCFSMSVPDSELCFPTRCNHLFNSTTGVVVPTPHRNSSDYTTFRCITETRFRYDAPALNLTCKVPVCECVFGSPQERCYPEELNSCAGHTCPSS